MTSETHPTLYGLVLAGGRSERMGSDKGLLLYRDRPQRAWLADLLASVCARVFISMRDASQTTPTDRHELLIDAPTFADNGPIGALLSANFAHPGHAWLVVSCDLPYFGALALDALLTRRDSTAPATAFINPEIGKPEPLVTIYEAGFMADLPTQFAAGERSMMRLLNRSPIARIERYDLRWIYSADTPEAFSAARQNLQG